MGCFVKSVPPSNGPASELFAALDDVGAGLDVFEVDGDALVVLGVLLLPVSSGRLQDEPAPGPDCRQSAPRRVTFCIPCDAEDLEGVEGGAREPGVLDDVDALLLPVLRDASVVLVAPIGDLGLEDVEVEPSRSSNSAKKLLETNELSVAC